MIVFKKLAKPLFFVALTILFVFSSCKEKDEDAGLLKSGDLADFDVLLKRPYYFPIESVQKVSPNGRFVVVETRFNNVSQVELLDKQTGTWRRIPNYVSSLRATDITNNGEVLLFSNDRFYLYDGVNSTQLPRIQQWDKYYLDQRGYLMWMQFSNSSVVSDKLFGRMLNASTWDTLDLNWPGALYTGNVNEQSTFVDMASNQLLKFNSIDKSWQTENFTYDFARINQNAGLNRKTVPYVGLNGLVYIAGFSGYALIQSGAATYINWPQGMLNYANPLSFEVHASGAVYALLNSMNGTNLMKYANSAWVAVMEGNAPAIRISGDMMYYPGTGTGELTFGLCEENLTNGTRNVLGDKRNEAELSDAIKLTDGTILVVSGGILMRYANGRFQQTSFVSDVYHFLTLANGNIFAFGKTHAYLSEDQGQTWQKQADYLKGQNGNGLPYVAKQLNDGSILLICVTSRRYYNSATKTTETLYSSTVFKSVDGSNWSLSGGISEASGAVTCIDPLGRMFRELMYTNPISYQTVIFVERSDDEGQTWKQVDISTPHLALDNEVIYALRDFHPIDGKIKKWDGSKWLDFKSSSSATTLNYFTHGVQNARLGSNGRLIILSNHLLFESKRLF